MSRKLPAGVTAASFNAALKELEAIVGKDWLFTSDDDLLGYRDAYSLRWNEANEYLASAAVAPDTVEQVAAIVKVANKYKLPVYPISTGKNLTYGGPAPSYTGSIVLDLKRMNRILKVDDKRNFALVEPGVSYFDFYRHLQENKLKVWMDCPDPGWGSLIGNALDHGVGYTSSMFRDHFGAHCGMEVVTPTGEIMRTGMGALPGADSWQDYRYGVGPHVDGLFGQGNFGIVTKMGFWLFPQPEAWAAAVVTVPRWADFGRLVEECNYLEDSQLMTGDHSFNSPVAGTAGVPNPALQALMAKGWPSPEECEAFVVSQGKPAWRARLQFFGPEKTIRANWEYTQERIGKAIPGATFQLEELLPMPLTPEQVLARHGVNFGVPNMTNYAMIGRPPDNPAYPPEGHIDMIAVCPRTAEGLHAAQRAGYEAFRSLGEKTNASPFGGPITWYHRSFLTSSGGVPNFRDDPNAHEKNKRGELIYATVMTALAKAGFGLYRTNVGMHDLLVEQFSFNDHALLRFQEALKDGVDPNGIVAPGRYGVWPKRLRGERQVGHVKGKEHGK